MLKFSKLCIERPIGTKGNNYVMDLLFHAFSELNYESIDLPFDCTVWQSDDSFVKQKDNIVKIFPSPFSCELKGDFPLRYISTIKELKELEKLKELKKINDCNDILVI